MAPRQPHGTHWEQQAGVMLVAGVDWRPPSGEIELKGAVLLSFLSVALQEAALVAALCNRQRGEVSEWVGGHLLPMRQSRITTVAMPLVRSRLAAVLSTC